jgi:hypothetical protein
MIYSVFSTSIPWAVCGLCHCLMGTASTAGAAPLVLCGPWPCYKANFHSSITG